MGILESQGWPMVVGLFDPEPWNEFSQAVGHCWNLTPDGQVFDATSAQFGLPEPLVTDRDNPLYLEHEVWLDLERHVLASQIPSKRQM